MPTFSKSWISLLCLVLVSLFAAKPSFARGSAPGLAGTFNRLHRDLEVAKEDFDEALREANHLGMEYSQGTLERFGVVLDKQVRVQAVYEQIVRVAESLYAQKNLSAPADAKLWVATARGRAAALERLRDLARFDADLDGEASLMLRCQMTFRLVRLYGENFRDLGRAIESLRVGFRQASPPQARGRS